MASVERVHLVTGTFRSPGAECRFYKVNRRGLKVYTDKSVACFAARTQRRLAKQGLAPKVFGKVIPVHVVDDGVSQCFAYFTQIAKRVGYVRKREYLTICNKLRMLGFRTGDVDEYGRNCGRIRGKLVLIDTGPATVS